MKPITIITTLTLCTTAVISGCTGSTTHQHHEEHHAITANNATTVDLSPEIKALLTQEMRELQKAMKEIVPALVAGQWPLISDIGNKMHDSYIMKKSLTKEQMHELHGSLPVGFQELDHDFHHSARLMAEAADKQDSSKVTFYYFRLTEACVECHTRYAKEKFPEFSRKTGQQH